MPVNSLSITKRELRKFEGTAESGRVDITGEYEVTIKNEGVLPILASQYEVQKLSPTSVNKTLITEKSGDIGRLSPGSSGSVNISFKISGNKDQLMTLARTGCNGNTIKCKVEEQISGKLLALPFDEKRDLSVSAGSCSLPSDVDQAPPIPEPEPTPSEPVQNLTMRFDEAVSPTEVTAGTENSWVINGNNINEVNQIRVELGDGSTTTTRREMQARNPQQPDNGGSQGLALSRAKQTGANDNTSSGVGQVFRHTYTSQGQYTIVAEAINSNGETVGSARYGVTVNPQVTTDPVEPEPTEPANFDITVNSKNEPVNPGGQMVINYTVENTGEASGTGNITLNVDGERADSSRTTVNAGSSTSGTLTATAPQINSSSVIFRPQISAEGIESNTVSPSFEVKQQEDDSEDQRDDRQQPDPAVLNLQITGTSSPVNIGQDLNVQYRVINTGGQSTNAVIDATTSSSNGRQTRVVETVNPGQSITGSLTIPSTAYGTSGNKTVTIQSQGSSAQNTFTVQEAQPDPAELNIGIARITDPVEVNESTNVRYTLSNSGGQTIEANIEASVDGNDNTKSDTQRLQPNDFLTKEMEIPSSFYGSAGTKTLRLSGRNETDTADFEVVEAAPDPAQLDIGMETNGPVNIGEDLDIPYILRNTGGQTTNANIDATISSANGVQAQAVETVNPGQAVQGELTVPSTAYGTAGEKTATLQVEGDSSQSNFTVQQQTTNRTRAEDIIANNEEREAASQLIAAYGNTLREWDSNNNGEIEINEGALARQAHSRGEVSQPAYDAVNFFRETGQQFPRNRNFEQAYLDHVNVIHEIDDNGNGELEDFEVLDAVNAVRNETGEYEADEVEAAVTLEENNVKFPKDSQAQQQNTFTPPTMDEVADSGF